jgi:hypothetical protein
MCEILKHYDMDLFTIKNDKEKENNEMFIKKRTHDEAFGNECENNICNISDKRVKQEEDVTTNTSKADDSQIFERINKPDSLSESLIAITCKANSSECLQNQKYRDQDILINLKNLNEILCKCNNCIEKYNKLNLKFLSEDFHADWINRVNLEEQLIKDVEEDTEENKNNLNNLNNCELKDIRGIKNLSMEKVILLNI